MSIDPVKTVNRMLEDHEFAHHFLKSQQEEAQQYISSLQTLEEQQAATLKFNELSTKLHTLWTEGIQQKPVSYGAMGGDEKKWCTCTHHYLLEEPESEMVRTLKKINALHLKDEAESNQLLSGAYTSEHVPLKGR
jgi:hypothetical protein